MCLQDCFPCVVLPHIGQHLVTVATFILILALDSSRALAFFLSHSNKHTHTLSHKRLTSIEKIGFVVVLATSVAFVFRVFLLTPIVGPM